MVDLCVRWSSLKLTIILSITIFPIEKEKWDDDGGKYLSHNLPSPLCLTIYHLSSHLKHPFFQSLSSQSNMRWHVSWHGKWDDVIVDDRLSHLSHHLSLNQYHHILMACRAKKTQKWMRDEIDDNSISSHNLPPSHNLPSHHLSLCCPLSHYLE